MKWMIASDLHGSAYYCGELLRAYRKEGAERLILLGDLLYHGPRNELPEGYDPKAVIGMLNGLKNEATGARGNCDAEVDQMVLEFPMMADYLLWPLGRHTIFATHGHLFHPEHLPPLRGGDLFLFGHTHIPLCQQKAGITLLNPGSVSLPKEGSPHSYLVFDGTAFLWKTLEGTVYERYAPDLEERRGG